jgi:hypothetical protein
MYDAIIQSSALDLDHTVPVEVAIGHKPCVALWSRQQSPKRRISTRARRSLASGTTVVCPRISCQSRVPNSRIIAVASRASGHRGSRASLRASTVEQ